MPIDHSDAYLARRTNRATGGFGTLWIIVLVAATAVAAAYWWRQQKNDAAIAAAAKTGAAISADQARRAIEQQTAALHAAQTSAGVERTDLAKAVAALASIEARWNDAAVLADSTSRIALAQPIQALQAIKREAEALIVPPCLEGPKRLEVEAMAKTIEGFLFFMRDSNIGKTIAQGNALEARELFAQAQREARLCPASIKPV
jgi:hypothetical protein